VGGLETVRKRRGAEGQVVAATVAGMKQQYDFAGGKRGAVLKSAAGKTRITIRLGDDVLAWFRKQAHAGGGGQYQTRVNTALRSAFVRPVEVERRHGRSVLRARCVWSPTPGFVNSGNALTASPHDARQSSDRLRNQGPEQNAWRGQMRSRRGRRPALWRFPSKSCPPLFGETRGAFPQAHDTFSERTPIWRSAFAGRGRGLSAPSVTRA
jgi:uncharacterized protein (DUF4415 family)